MEKFEEFLNFFSEFLQEVPFFFNTIYVEKTFFRPARINQLVGRDFNRKTYLTGTEFPDQMCSSAILVGNKKDKDGRRRH